MILTSLVIKLGAVFHVSCYAIAQLASTSHIQAAEDLVLDHTLDTTTKHWQHIICISNIQRLLHRSFNHGASIGELKRNRIRSKADLTIKNRQQRDNCRSEVNVYSTK